MRYKNKTRIISVSVKVLCFAYCSIGFVEHATVRY